MSKRAQILWQLSPFLYRQHTYWKAWQQEMRIANERAQYSAYDTKFSNDGSSIKIEQLKKKLRERLIKNGVSLKSKGKGELHIVYATRPSDWEPHNIPPELSKIGKVTAYYYSNRGYQDNAADWILRRSQMQEDLLTFIKEVHQREPIDAFVGYLSGWQVAAETILTIGQMGIPTFGFHWDDKLSFRGELSEGRWSGPAAVASAYDLNLTNSPSSIIKYEAEGGLSIFHQDGEDMYSLVQNVKTQIDRYRLLTLPQPGRMTRVIREHAAVVDAIEAHDADRAAAAMQGHLDGLRVCIDDIRRVNPDFFYADIAGKEPSEA